MVRFNLIILIIIIIVLNGCYKVIPRKYFKTYSKILVKNTLNDMALDFTKVYIAEDSFLSDYYSEKFNTKIKNQTYIYIYKNHLLARINIPVHCKSGKWILSEEEYFKAVAEKTIDFTEDYFWTYYSIKDKYLIEYDLDYDAGNWNALDIVKIAKTKFILLDKGIILEHNYKKNINDTVELNKYILKKSDTSFKPDSTKSDIYCRFTYKQKGYRRIYARNSPDYINPCQIINKDIKK